jgi:DNA (cytosine-5)-methyltransferase 1
MAITRSTKSNNNYCATAREWGGYILVDDKPDTKKATDKPPYRVPLMTEIAALPWNGHNVISTFSGCGGSCLGYRMAGFRVLWANEFIPAAQATYKANHPDSILDTRDIRTVQPEEILEATGLKSGELDIFDGSPPCAAFSTAGKREAGWGKVKNYSDTKQRVDDLFFEYTRILNGLQPKVFVAENVSGLVKGTAKGYFIEILRALKACGYNVKCKVLDAQWLGVPQSRQRTIFIGVRNDLGLDPVHPMPLPYRYSVRDALPWILKAVHDTSGTFSQGEISDRPCPAITVGIGGMNACYYKVEAETDISRFAIGAEWDKLKPGEQSEKYFNLVRQDPEQPSGCITVTAGNQSAAGICHPTEKRKFSIAELRRICGFPDDFIFTGTYSQQWERMGRAVPPVMMCKIAETIRDKVLNVDPV